MSSQIKISKSDLDDAIKIDGGNLIFRTDSNNYLFEITWEPESYVQFAVNRSALRDVINHLIDCGISFNYLC